MLMNHQSRRRPLRAFGALGLGAVLVAAPGTAAQEEATPAAYAEEGSVSAIVMDVEGNEIGAAVFIPIEGGTHVEIEVQGMPEGDHGIHIHQMGVCDPGGDEPFGSAGDHFNPTGAHHGGPMIGNAEATPEAEQAHAGDLGNITIGSDGSGSLTMDTNAFVLDEGAENSLRDEDGSAIVVHADPDDLTTDPSGNSGARIACGVIFEPGQSEGEDVVATPTENTVATPSASN